MLRRQNSLVEKFWKHRLTRCAMSDTQEPWETTAVQNLMRYRPSGTYFARFRAGGKLIRQSLDTAVFSVAKQRLPDMMRDYRSRNESVKAFAHGKMTVRDAAEVYLRKVRASVSLKPRSKDYREMIIDFISRSWPSLMEMDVRKVSDRDCENRTEVGYSQMPMLDSRGESAHHPDKHRM